MDFIRIELPDGSHPDGFYPNEIENRLRQKNYPDTGIYISRIREFEKYLDVIVILT